MRMAELETLAESLQAANRQSTKLLLSQPPQLGTEPMPTLSLFEEAGHSRLDGVGNYGSIPFREHPGSSGVPQPVIACPDFVSDFFYPDRLVFFSLGGSQALNGAVHLAASLTRTRMKHGAMRIAASIW
jgi:hypothetical protein